MPELTAIIRPVREFPNLEAHWRALEGQFERPFFLSWDWAATVIEIANDNLLVAEVRSRQGVVALGLLAPVTERRHGVMRVRQLRLNETGPDTARSVFIEYNTLLATPEMETLAWDALVAALHGPASPRWDEIVVTNACVDLERHLKNNGLLVHRRSEYGSAFADLDELRAKGVKTATEYIATLGKSTRSQINRSIKLYRKRGSLKLERAATMAEAQAYLGEIGKLQKEKWRVRGRNNDACIDLHLEFHRAFIGRTFVRGKVELVRISSNAEPFAWVYNFVDHGHVLFDGGGFKTESDNRLKPGLVAHTLLIEDHLQAGRSTYDFLAGDDRYKLNLGQAGPNFIGFSIQRPTFILRVESALRRVKQFLEGVAQAYRS